MSVSLEALAMAGADYLEWDMDVEEWEQKDLEPPLPHLLVEEEVTRDTKHGHCFTFPHQPLEDNGDGGNSGDGGQITADYRPKMKQNMVERLQKFLRSRIVVAKAIMRVLMLTGVYRRDHYF